MTVIENLQPRVQYTYTTGNQLYPITFSYIEREYVKVMVRDQVLTYNVHYTVPSFDAASLEAEQLNIEILITPSSDLDDGITIANGDLITIYRSTAVDQQQEFPQNAKFSSQKITEAVDKLTHQQQEQDDALSQCLHLSKNVTTEFNAELPVPESDKALKWNEDATGLINSTVTMSQIEEVSGFLNESVIADVHIVAEAAESGDLEDVANLEDYIPTVAGVASSIPVVAEVASDITTVATDLNDEDSKIEAVADIVSDVSAVADIASNVTTVANISSAVSAVSSNSTNVNTVATNIGSVITAANNTVNIDKVANAIDHVEAVSGDLSNVDIVAGAVNNVNKVGNSISNVNIVAGAVANEDLETVADNIANVNLTGGSIANVNKVGNNIDNVNAVAGNETNINAVKNNATNINTVAGISNKVTTVAGISSAVSTVAGIASDVTAVKNNANNINSVSSNANNINTVAGIASDISGVIDIAGDVTDVANIKNDVTAVSDIKNAVSAVSSNSTNVSTVAGMESNIQACVTNMTDINNAATNAQSASSSAILAQKWAVQLDTPVEGSDYSAKYYALQAQQATEGVADVKVDGTSVVDENNVANINLSDYHYADDELSNLADAGEERLHSAKGYKDNGEVLSDELLYQSILDGYNNAYDNTAFDIIGSPTVSTEGIASDFSSTSYVQSKCIVDFTKSFTITVNEKRSSNTNFRGFGVGRINNLSYPIVFVQNSNTATKITLGLYVGGTLSTHEYEFTHSSYTDINYIVSWDGETYTFKIIDTVTGNVALDESVTSSTGLSRDSDTTGKVIYGYNFNEGSIIVSTDLKLSSVINDGATLLNGIKTKTDVYYTDNYKVAGTLTISDGWASGFGQNNYISTGSFVNNLGDYDNWEIEVHSITASSTTSTYYGALIHNKSGNDQALHVDMTNSKRLRVFVKASDGSNIFYNSSTSDSFDLSSPLDLKIKFTGTQYLIQTRISGEDWKTQLTANNTKKIMNLNVPFIFGSSKGGGNSSWNGSIDAKSIKFKGNGKLIYIANLSIPYIETSNDLKIVDVSSRDKVVLASKAYSDIDYLTIDTENENVTLPYGNIYEVLGNKIPDYASAITIASSPYTITTEKYLLFESANLTLGSCEISINGVRVAYATEGAGTATRFAGGIYPVRRGDIITFTGSPVLKVLDKRGA